MQYSSRILSLLSHDEPAQGFSLPHLSCEHEDFFFIQELDASYYGQGIQTPQIEPGSGDGEGKLLIDEDLIPQTVVKLRRELTNFERAVYRTMLRRFL
jgi:hypothetical protein